MAKSAGFIAHGGGPTAALNASLQGVVEAARAARLPHLWAARGGLGGLFRGEVLDLLSLPAQSWSDIGNQPGSIIGSFRGAISTEEMTRAIAFFRRQDVRYCLYTGGNGSMETAMAISAAAGAQGYELNTIGIPKTIDNDIEETDHCPGFGSAARFVAIAVREIGLDQRALPSPVSIIEVMGRNTGWLAAASIAARERPGDPPHFIYVPELAFDPKEFVARVDRLLRKQGWVVGVVAEGLRDGSGCLIAGGGGANRDAKGRPLPGNTALALAALVTRQLRVRARSEKPGLLCRASSLSQSSVDAAEARAMGRYAVKMALEGKSDVMIAIRRIKSPSYRAALETVPLYKVAGRERRLTAAYLSGAGNIRTSYRNYVEPLMGDALAPAVYI
ncbi:MAG: diphosphate--fructose-6-phosphate 1-phosphotransferase [Terriglobia bacterium]